MSMDMDDDPLNSLLLSDFGGDFPLDLDFTDLDPTSLSTSFDIPTNHTIAQQTYAPPPPPPQTTAHSSTELINNLLQYQIGQDTQLRLLREKQKTLFAAPSNEALNVLFAEEKALYSQLQTELQNLEMLTSQVLLTPGELHRVDYLRNEFQLQTYQLQLYIHEIEQLLMQQRVTAPIATLVISRQPFPCVPSKNQQLTEGELIVQLLTGAATTVVGCSPVKGMVVIDNTQGRTNEEKAISGHTQPLDNSVLKAQFPITFEEGTRKNVAKIRFVVDVQVEQSGHAASGSLETITNSAPYVVMTNQKQWEGCERTLLQRDAFGGSLEITWLQFANALQRQFIRATRQEPQNPSRCLSPFDFAYLHEKFIMKRPFFQQREYEGFWNWYGKCIQVIRYQRHIGVLWQEGLLYGFMTREEVTMALDGEPPGTFVLRFSERHAGQIGIAYVGTEVNSIKHYLVQPNDTAAAKVTLPDFLRDKPQFGSMLQFTLLPSGTPQFRRLPKDQVLGQLYSRRTGGDTSGSGYDPLT